MTKDNIDLLARQFNVVEFLENEGIKYKETAGHSGPQIVLQTCPFCGNKKWKVYANKETGYGNCFVCETTFNKMSLVKVLLGDIPWSKVYDYVNTSVVNVGFVFKKKQPTVYVHDNAVVLPNSEPLPFADGSNLPYLECRGITGELASYFHLRYCQKGEWRYMKENEWRERDFSHRVIVPIYDLDGSLQTFQGRDITGTAGQKYLFPATLPGAGRFLYNGHNATLAKRVVLTEGVFDTFAAKIALDDDESLRDIVPIASFGKHLSSGKHVADDQLSRFLQLKNMHLEEVIVMWDGEENALRAAIRAGRILRQVGLSVKMAFLPKEKDPNEVPPFVVCAAIANAKPLTDANCITWSLNNPYR